MPTTDLNDTTVYYERTGGGPAVLFVHGMCGDAEVWADQARRLCERYTCVRYDRRGHRRSHRSDAVITDALHADDVAALVETLGVAPCLLVASSGGAAIAVDLALRYGHLLRGAVFSEPPLFCLDRDAGKAMMERTGPSPRGGHRGRRAPSGGRRLLLAPLSRSVVDHRRDPQGPLPRQRRHRPH